MSETPVRQDVRRLSKLPIGFWVAHLSLFAISTLAAAVGLLSTKWWWLTLVSGVWLLISIWGFIDMRRSHRSDP